MNEQIVHEDHMIGESNIYTTSQLERRRYVSVLLNRSTVNLVRRIDPFRRLSRIIVDYANYFLARDNYDPDWFVEYRRRLIRDYGPPNYFTTSVTPKAVELLKEVRDHVGLRSIADAFDLVALYHVYHHYCGTHYSNKPSICYSDEALAEKLAEKKGKK